MQLVEARCVITFQNDPVLELQNCTDTLCLYHPISICFLQTHSFSSHKMLTDGLKLCGLLVDYHDVFISCLDLHSDGTHSLQRISW